MHLRTPILLALLASFPLQAAKKPDPYDERVNGLLEIIDGATRSGAAVILSVIPHGQDLEGVQTSMMVPGLLLANGVNALPPFSARMYWKHDKDPKQHYMPEFSSNTLENKPTAYLWEVLELHVVTPGTYRLTSAESYRIDATLAKLPKPAAAGSETDGVQGRVRLEQVTYRQRYLSKEWSPPGSINERQTRQVCTSVQVVSGNCMSYAEQEYWTEKHVNGFWEEKTRERDVPAVRVQAGIPAEAAPLAFTIKPGQVLLSDRFMVVENGIDYAGPDKCNDINANTRDCLLRRFTVHVKPGPINAVRTYIALKSSRLTAAQKKLMARLEPMQVQVLGRTGTPDPLLGTPVSLRKPAD